MHERTSLNKDEVKIQRGGYIILRKKMGWGSMMFLIYQIRGNEHLFCVLTNFFLNLLPPFVYIPLSLNLKWGELEVDGNLNFFKFQL